MEMQSSSLTTQTASPLRPIPPSQSLCILLDLSLHKHICVLTVSWRMSHQPFYKRCILHNQRICKEDHCLKLDKFRKEYWILFPLFKHILASYPHTVLQYVDNLQR